MGSSDTSVIAHNQSQASSGQRFFAQSEGLLTAILKGFEVLTLLVALFWHAHRFLCSYNENQIQDPSIPKSFLKHSP